MARDRKGGDLMATITLTFDNALQARIVNGLAGANNYASYVESGGTLTQAQFAKKVVVDFIKTTIKNYEGGSASQTAFNTTAADVDNVIIIT